LDVHSWHEDAFEDAARGKTDVVLWANRAPPPMQSEEILSTELVCIFSNRHPLAGKRLTLERYLACRHVDIAVLRNKPSFVDNQVTTAGLRRNIVLRVPYFGSAFVAIENSDLVATLPRIAVDQYVDRSKVVVCASPFKFEPVRVLMSWHPTKTSAPASRWFRDLLRRVAKDVAGCE
jgi:DNA-binding transcriptional LysR family regulator